MIILKRGKVMTKRQHFPAIFNLIKISVRIFSLSKDTFTFFNVLLSETGFNK